MRMHEGIHENGSHKRAYRHDEGLYMPLLATSETGGFRVGKGGFRGWERFRTIVSSGVKMSNSVIGALIGSKKGVSEVLAHF